LVALRELALLARLQAIRRKIGRRLQLIPIRIPRTAPRCRLSFMPRVWADRL
jgi:hypothetical protein